jgi:hypothetical protein
MKFTPRNLAFIYMMLCQLRPFKNWTMPDQLDINFVVSSDPDVMGTYIYDDEKEKHIITISRIKNGHLDTVIKTMAHEMIHMRRWKTSGWDKHDVVFRKYATQVATELGFDAFEL